MFYNSEEKKMYLQAEDYAIKWKQADYSRYF